MRTGFHIGRASSRPSAGLLAREWLRRDSGLYEPDKSLWTAPAIDGSMSGIQAGAGSGPVVALTTTIANDLIVAMIAATNLTGISLPTSTHLTFSQRYNHQDSTTGNWLGIFYASASGTLTSESISSNVSGATGGSITDMVVFGVSGVGNLGAPFDGNVSLPAFNSSASNVTPSVSSVSTSNATDMIISIVAASGIFGGNPGAGYTNINVDHVDTSDNQYQVVSGAQSGITVSFGSGDASSGGFAMVVDAISGSGVLPFLSGTLTLTETIKI